MRSRWISIVFALMFVVTMVQLTFSPGHATGLTVNSDRVTVQIVPNPLP